MMSREQFLLMKLGEEGKEVGQMTDKTIQFGFYERYPGLKPNGQPHEDNKERLHAEINDFIAHIEMLNEEFDFGYVPNLEAIARKKQKVNIYYQYSVSLGRVEALPENYKWSGGKPTVDKR